MICAFDQAVRALAAGGAEIVTFGDPVDFEQILIDHRIVMAAEAAHITPNRSSSHPRIIPPGFANWSKRGASLWARDHPDGRGRHDQNPESH